MAWEVPTLMNQLQVNGEKKDEHSPHPFGRHRPPIQKQRVVQSPAFGGESAFVCGAFVVPAASVSR